MGDNSIQKRNTNPVLKMVNYVLRTFKMKTHPKKEPAGASWQDIRVVINPEINRYLEMRHVSEDEVKQVIYHAETTKEKLFQPDSGKFLAKLRIGKATFYVEYYQGTDSFTVQSAYAHKSEITG
jgi:hypothetical protein